MSEQDGIQSSTKQRRSRKTSSDNQQNGKQAPAVQRPENVDGGAWKAYWKQQNQSWRTEPEIDEERQKYLAVRRNITPDIEKGIYPFRDIKLSRADVEWLLATHENGEGPIPGELRVSGHGRGLDLRGANLRNADLNRLPLAQLRGGLNSVEWTDATQEQREAAAVHMEGANLVGTDLRHATFRFSFLAEVDLNFAQLEGAVLINTHLAADAVYRSADLRNALFDHNTYLGDIILGNKKYGSVRLADIHWGDANLALVDLEQLNMLGDEQEARKAKLPQGLVKNKERRLKEYQSAVRANRQLAAALQSQGLNEKASRFAYRAQKLQRIVLRRQKKFGQYLFSGFLDTLAGYGYRPGRSVLWYLATIFGFALAYFAIGHLPFIPDALVFSLTSFHGRGFFPGLGNADTLHNPLVVLAALEAVVGLLIEISFIATFTQRFFGR